MAELFQTQVCLTQNIVLMSLLQANVEMKDYSKEHRQNLFCGAVAGLGSMGRIVDWNNFPGGQFGKSVGEKN